MTARFAVVVVCGLGVAACDMEPTPSIVVQACSIDSIGGTTGEPPAASLGAKIEVRGWAADPMGKRVARNLVVHLVGANGAVAASGARSASVPRPDVAAHFKIPELGSAGFHVEISTAGIAPGVYDLMVESRFEKVHAVCRPNRTVMLK